MEEQRLERALRKGPRFATPYIATNPVLDESLVTRRAAGVGRSALLIVVTALLLTGLFAGLAALGSFRDTEPGARNGWVAFSVWDGDASAESADRDIFLVAADEAPRRIIGDDTENVDQICPALSPDGRRLAYGQAEGIGAEFADEGNYRDAALVIVDIDADGNASNSVRFDVGGSLPPPCATWSADSNRVAFGVSRTSWNFPERSATDSEVRVVTLEGAEIDVIPDVFATDLAWSPVGSELAIASHEAGQPLNNGAISLYSADAGDVRTLVGASAVSKLGWSPDGLRIVSQRGDTAWTSGPRPEGGQLWVTEVDGSGEYLVADGFDTDHGIGPEWSPTGEWIVYQPICDESHVNPGAPCREESDVVLIPADGELESRNPGDGEVIIPHVQLPGDDGSVLRSPFRVIWSPDGKELLYWTFGGPTLIAVPIDSSSPPVVLYDGRDGGDLSVLGGDGLLPIQSWGKQAEDQP